MIDLIRILFHIIIWALTILSLIAGIVLGVNTCIKGTNRERLMVVIRLAVAVLVAILVYQWRDSVMWCLAACGIVLAGGDYGEPEEEGPIWEPSEAWDPYKEEDERREQIEQRLAEAIKKRLAEGNRRNTFDDALNEMQKDHTCV